MSVQDQTNFTRDDWSVHNKPLMIVAVLLIAGICFAAGTLFSRIDNNVTHRRVSYAGNFRSSGYGFGSRAFGSTGLSRVAGVITAINGTSLTVAGDGTTKTVAVNSSTQYGNDSAPKLEDSILAFGTTSDGTFTASRVVLNP